MRELPQASTEVRDAVEAFLYLEAYLLDNHRYRDWVETFATDGVYLVPTDTSASDPASSVNIAYENKAALEDRVARLETGLAHAQDPRSETLRAVSNVVVERHEMGLAAHSIQAVTESRLGAVTHYTARMRHELLGDVASGFSIRLRRVDLVNAGDAHGNLTFIL